MKKLMFILSFLLLNVSAWSQKTAALWYLPTMNTYQAMSLAPYDLVVIDIENLFNNSGMLDLMISENPKIKIFAYLNQTEIFDPMFNDKPWSIKLLEELKQKPQWWLKQPDGKTMGAWTGMKALDMRFDCPEIDGQKYYQWMAAKYLEVLKDPRISGCLLDNSWGDDVAGISWLATYNGNKGFDFNGDKKADTDLGAINASWTKGMKEYIKLIREAKGEDFTIIANPGNLSYKEVDGKQFENFPYIYHQLSPGHDWEANIMIARKFKIAIINPDLKDWFFGAATTMLLDNEAYLCVQQNEPYRDYYDLELGSPLSKTKEIEPGIWSRQFTKGNVFVNPKLKKAWIEYKDGRKREK